MRSAGKGQGVSCLVPPGSEQQGHERAGARSLAAQWPVSLLSLVPRERRDPSRCSQMQLDVGEY